MNTLILYANGIRSFRAFPYIQEVSMKKYPVIDFHTHPFVNMTQNICAQAAHCDMSMENIRRDYQQLGIDHICGSVIQAGKHLPKEITWEYIQSLNNDALYMRDYFDGFYIPGFHIHPGFVKESIAEIERMHKLGVNLIGELVPYLHGWSDYEDKNLFEILEAAEHYDMVVSTHGANHDKDDALVSHFKKLKIVGAHPGEPWTDLPRHFKRLEENENYYIDWSGYGLFRHGALRAAIDRFGKERNLFGSDYPTCNPAMYLGGVSLEFLLTEEEKEYVLYKNAARLLKLDK